MSWSLISFLMTCFSLERFEDLLFVLGALKFHGEILDAHVLVVVLSACLVLLIWILESFILGMFFVFFLKSYLPMFSVLSL